MLELPKNEDYLNFQGGFLPFKSDGKWGFYDSQLNVVILNKFDEVEPFNDEGYASVKLEGSWGVIDKYGKLVISNLYECSNS